MAPIFFQKMPFLAKPVHKKLFGKHKTWRGLLLAPLMSIIVFWLQKVAFSNGFTSWALIDYADFSLLLGFLLGAGAILGDLVKSYYKRKGGLAPGERWIPFDQVDFIIGGLVLSWFVYVPSAKVVLILLIAGFFLQIIFKYLGFVLKLSDVKM